MMMMMMMMMIYTALVPYEYTDRHNKVTDYI